jgi:uncharacterized protein (TIGR03437 family)
MEVRQYLIRLSCAALCAAGAWAQQFNISTFAGNGTQGFTGDGGAAKSAEMFLPGRVVVDSSGHVYIADGGNNRIRVVSGGNISTFAGNGTGAFAGDGKAATSAELNNPSGIALDSSGNLYIADSDNHVVRKVSGGNISTVAGRNIQGYTGDSGAATSAELSFPVAVALDSSGDIFIADAGNNVIRKVSNSDSTISTVVGGPATTLQLSHPDGLAIDKNNVLYIVDTDNRRIVKFANGAATVIAGNGDLNASGDGGPALEAGLGDPMGVAVDNAGNLYIADTFNSRVRKISPDGIINTIAGTGITAYFGDGGPALKSGIYFPHDVTADSSGNVYVADTFNNVVRLLEPVAPTLSANGVVNAANYKAQVSPGALASAFGTGFVNQNVGATTLPLNSELAGVSVSVNGKAAPVLYLTPNQVNFQIPWETALGTASITVSVNGRASNAVTVPVVTAAPGVILASGRAVVQNSDGTLNSSSNPAKSGSTVTAYAIGSGPVSPSVADGVGSPTNPPALITSPVSVTIGSKTAQTSFAGLAPGFVGLVQLNIVVPSGLTTGDYQLEVTIAGQASNSAAISVSQ